MGYSRTAVLSSSLGPDLRILAGRAEERRLADKALDVEGLLVRLELRLGRAARGLGVALTLLRSLGTLYWREELVVCPSGGDNVDIVMSCWRRSRRRNAGKGKRTLPPPILRDVEEEEKKSKSREEE